jgi:hypothetical protein
MKYTYRVNTAISLVKHHNLHFLHQQNTMSLCLIYQRSPKPLIINLICEDLNILFLLLTQKSYKNHCTCIQEPNISSA